MSESKFKPIVFLAFANEQGDGSQYLRKLPDELRALKAILEPLEERGFKLVIAPNATLQDIQDA